MPALTPHVVIAAFDFDGTLTWGDTLLSFLARGLAGGVRCRRIPCPSPQGNCKKYQSNRLPDQAGHALPAIKKGVRQLGSKSLKNQSCKATLARSTSSRSMASMGSLAAAC
jgi:hypothetical protein